MLRSDTSLMRQPRPVRTASAWTTAGEDVRSQGVGISVGGGPQVHGDQVGPDPGAVRVEASDAPLGRVIRPSAVNTAS